MGFMDKAKKMAEQAQEKLDDVQKQFNESQGAKGAAPASGAPVTEYDKHGRPVGETPGSAAPPPSSPPPGPASEPGSPPVPPPEAPAPPAQPPAPPKPPSGDLAPPSGEQDEYAAPKLSSGDPLAG